MTDSDNGALGAPIPTDPEEYRVRYARAEQILASVLSPEQIQSIDEGQYRQLVELQMAQGDEPIIQPDPGQQSELVAGQPVEQAPTPLQAPAQPPADGKQEPSMGSPMFPPEFQNNRSALNATREMGSTQHTTQAEEPFPAAFAGEGQQSAAFNPTMAAETPSPSIGDFEPKFEGQPQEQVTQEQVTHEQATLSAEQQQEAIYNENIPPKKSGGLLKNAMILGGALIFGGGAAYGYKTFIDTKAPVQSGAVTIRASNAAIKETPADRGGRKIANQEKGIYNRIGGNPQPARKVAESLGRSPEKPMIDRNRLGQPSVRVNKVPIKPFNTQHPLKNKNTGGLVGPNKVQTFTVLPDGRVIRPKARQNQQPREQRVRQQQIAAVNPANTVGTRVENIPSGVQNQLRAIAPQPLSGSTPDDRVSLPQKAPARPQVANLGGPSLEPLVRSQPAAQAAVQAPAITDGFVVQVASLRSQEKALERFADIQQKHPSLLGQYGPNIQRADLGDRGIFFRLRVGPIADKTDAAVLCSRLKSAGQDCYVRATQ